MNKSFFILVLVIILSLTNLAFAATTPNIILSLNYCGGTAPTTPPNPAGSFTIGANTYQLGYTPTSWTPIIFGTPNECQWKCNNGYINQSGNCIKGEYVCPVFNISCTSSTPFINSVMAYINNIGIECGYQSWQGNDAIFTCNAPNPNYINKVYDAVCEINQSRSYAEPGYDINSTKIQIVDCGPINALCGINNNLCSSGQTEDIPDNLTHYLWKCLGINGGTNESCSLAKCGNWQVDIGEECDDGNIINNDGCNSSCGWEKIKTAWSEVQANPTFISVGTNSFVYMQDNISCNGLQKGTGCNPAWPAYISTNVGCAAANIPGENNFSCSYNNGKFNCNIKIPNVFNTLLRYYGCINRNDGRGIIQSSIEYVNVSGDRIKQPDEQCDNGTLNSNSCFATPNLNCSYCTNTCIIRFNSTGVCGDGILDPANDEQCDNGTWNSNSCRAYPGADCSYCNISCKIGINSSIQGKSCSGPSGCLGPNECCYGFSQYRNGTCITSLPSGTTNATINSNICLCFLSVTGRFGNRCSHTGDYPCWDTRTGSCCGNEQGETWDTALSTSKLLDDILIEGYCSNGKWVSRDDYQLTYYDIWVTG
jgi:cysteine-rich repeat protein